MQLCELLETLVVAFKIDSHNITPPVFQEIECDFQYTVLTSSASYIIGICSI